MERYNTYMSDILHSSEVQLLKPMEYIVADDYVVRPQEESTSDATRAQNKHVLQNGYNYVVAPQSHAPVETDRNRRGSRGRFLRNVAMATAVAGFAAVGLEAETVEAAASYEKTHYPRYPNNPTWITVTRPVEGKDPKEWKKVVDNPVIPGLVRTPTRTVGPTSERYESGDALISKVDGEFPIPNIEVGWDVSQAAPGENNVQIKKDEQGNVIEKTIGRGNNTLLIAHKTPGKGVEAPFRNLNETQAGDIIWITTVGDKKPDGTYESKVYQYRVVVSEVLPNSESWDKYGKPTEEEVLTLYGCEGDPIYATKKVGNKTVKELVNRTHKRCVRAVRVI
jgi:sortase (surface protein transpeptidase)